MELDDALTQIVPEWHADFLRFHETGDASDELLAYLDEHEQCGELIECVFGDSMLSDAEVTR